MSAAPPAGPSAAGPPVVSQPVVSQPEPDAGGADLDQFPWFLTLDALDARIAHAS